MKRSNLKPGSKRLARRTKLARGGKWAGASARARAKLRKRERWRRTFGPPGFVQWLKAQPCERCGAPGPNEVHHEPTRGAGGTWIDTTAACKACHRRRHRIGVKAYWQEVGRDYGEAARLVQGRWLARGQMETWRLFAEPTETAHDTTVSTMRWP